jgi:hypothetical protein
VRWNFLAPQFPIAINFDDCRACCAVPRTRRFSLRSNRSEQALTFIADTSRKEERRRVGRSPAPSSQGAKTSYPMIFHFFWFSLAQSRVKAAECSLGVRMLKSMA